MTSPLDPASWEPASGSGHRRPWLDAARPSPARVYDYLLGGKDNFAADRIAAEKMVAALPSIRVGAQENRRFLLRGVRCLAAEMGMRQFLDIGTGIPISPNVHEVVQSVMPGARVAYVDNDPVVLAHARALMVSGPGGEVGYLEADIREPDSIIGSDLVRHMLDFDEPVALVLNAVLHFIPDAEGPAEILRALIGALPPGSHVLASHLTPEHNAGLMPASDGYNDDGVRTQPRTRAEFERLVFADQGLELVEPGVVLVSRWRRDPDDPPAPTPAEVSAYGGLARLP
ncbi:SAM-dependent methyltransferase [Spirillospora sp. NPDC048911]|uniref:SAM-dependent methyltransferase n=1 Tax=Spirillospora sp. NPDC048911 TaxID=3364527 RepID=UPI00371D81EE